MRNDRRANIPSCECISQQAPASRCRLQVLAYGHRVPDQCVDALQLGPTTARRVSSGSVKARNAPEQQAAREWWSRPPSAGSRKASTEKCFGSRRGEEARSSKYRATHPPATAAPHCAETAKLSGCICAAVLWPTADERGGGRTREGLFAPTQPLIRLCCGWVAVPPPPGGQPGQIQQNPGQIFSLLDLILQLLFQN